MTTIRYQHTILLRFFFSHSLCHISRAAARSLVSRDTQIFHEWRESLLHCFARTSFNSSFCFYERHTPYKITRIVLMVHIRSACVTPKLKNFFFLQFSFTLLPSTSQKLWMKSKKKKLCKSSELELRWVRMNVCTSTEEKKLDYELWARASSDDIHIYLGEWRENTFEAPTHILRSRRTAVIALWWP